MNVEFINHDNGDRFNSKNMQDKFEELIMFFEESLLYIAT